MKVRVFTLKERNHNMKRKIVSIILVGILLSLLSMQAFATPNFNTSVFNNADDVTVEYDDMSGSTNAYSTSLIGSQGNVRLDWDYDYVSIYPHVSVSNSMDVYVWCIDYFARNWAFIDKIIIKIGDTRYEFSNLTTTRKVYSDTTIREHLSFVITNKTLSLMQDLVEHRNEKIKVRLVGSSDNIDFFLPDEVKDGLINLYNLYSMGGGTNSSNMELLTKLDDTGISIRRN